MNPAVGDVPKFPVGGDPAKVAAGRFRVFGGMGILQILLVFDRSCKRRD